MAAVRLTVRGGRAMRRTLRRLGREAPRSAARALAHEAEAVMGASKDEVDVDEGTLRGSGFVRPPEIGAGRVTVTLGYGGAAEGYAVYLHEGTGPAVGRPAFFPPVEPIREWAERKGIDIEPFVLARSIGRKGLEPRKFLERPLTAAADGMPRRLGARMRRDLERRARG